MTVTFTDEQHDFASSVREFCRRDVGTREQRDKLTDRGRRPHSLELNRKVADLGWAAIGMPEAYGGAGGNHVDLCILLEELCRGMAPLPGIGTTLVTGGIYNRFADEQLKKSVLGRIAEGAALAISMSEPGAGSDVAALTCRAERTQFGQPVGSFQALKHRLADLATEIECARLLVYSVATQADDPRPGVNLSRASSMAKLKVTEVAKSMAIEGMQMMGGYDYATEFDMVQHVRTALAAKQICPHRPVVRVPRNSPSMRANHSGSGAYLESGGCGPAAKLERREPLRPSRGADARSRRSGEFPAAAEQSVEQQGVPHVAVQSVLGGEPDPAEHLLAVPGGRERGPPGGGLGEQRTELVVRMGQRGLRSLERDEGLREAVSDRLERGDRPTELGPVEGVRAGQCEHGPPGPDQPPPQRAPAGRQRDRLPGRDDVDGDRGVQRGTRCVVARPPHPPVPGVRQRENAPDRAPGRDRDHVVDQRCVGAGLAEHAEYQTDRVVRVLREQLGPADLHQRRVEVGPRRRRHRLAQGVREQVAFDPVHRMLSHRYPFPGRVGGGR